MGSQPGFLNKNQNLTLHFRPVKAASAGEVFLCALGPSPSPPFPPPPPAPAPSRSKHQASAPSRSSSLKEAQPRGARAAPPLPAWLLSRPSPSMQLARPGPSGTAPPPASSESPSTSSPPESTGEGVPPTHKTGGLAVSTTRSLARIPPIAATPTRVPSGRVSNPRAPN